LAVLLVLFALAGCTTERTAPPRPTPPPAAPATSASSSGPVDLPAPVEFAQVLPSGGVSVLPEPSRGERLSLAKPFLTVTHLEDAAVQHQEYSDAWVVVFDLTDDDARTFGEWTAAHVGERMAMVARGRVISAPTIESAITDGKVQVSSEFSEHAAADLLAQITG
jgi:preprotein translocase subunit SecD